MAPTTRGGVAPLFLVFAVAKTATALLTSCPAGTGIPEGSVDCTECPAGTWSSEGSYKCQECQPGQYSSEAGSSTCRKCPTGTWSDRRGASSISFCELCAPGTHNSLEGSTSVDSCIKCPKGSFSEHAGAEECDRCPPGTYGDSEQADSKDMCVACPAGTAQKFPGQSRKEVCYPCGPGTYSDEAASRCRACPSGTWNAELNAAQCQACPSGKWTRQPQATSPDQCQSCFGGQEWCGSNEVEVQGEVNGVDFESLDSRGLAAFKRGVAEGISEICEIPLATVVAPSGENSTVKLTVSPSGAGDIEAYVVESVRCTFQDLAHKMTTPKFRTELQKSVGPTLAPIFDNMAVTVRSVTQTNFELPKTTTTARTSTSTSSSSSTTAAPTTTTAAATTTSTAAAAAAAGGASGAKDQTNTGSSSGGSFLSTSKIPSLTTSKADGLNKDSPVAGSINANVEDGSSEGGGLPSWFWGILGGIIVAILVLLWHILAARRRLKKGEKEKENENEQAPGMPADGSAATVPDGKDTERFANLQGPRSLSAPEFLRTTMDDVEESGMHMWFDGEVAEGPRSAYDCTKGCTVWC
eukprot:CAMPEP_0206580406 /NCGR_PEP_ID=MMETSP0325_2-20121206/33140_1 /ASSEMBLY_ACC=CAM_ASM_000347 /TAXON_ID=2866 /ORGANISM="Crypthecodinium cohnii, Strain Seligo" /LENGTH=580 /DNA_ID=CAMNT_0054086431 /DNA_START=77 /DNA_END=1819 /DNA_ORIENTATION=+